jgi:hypothetical protein
MGRNGWIVLGIVLLALAAGAFFLEGFSWVTEETVIDAGPLQVTAEEEQRVGLPLWASLVLGAGGVVALAVGMGKKG